MSSESWTYRLGVSICLAMMAVGLLAILTGPILGGDAMWICWIAGFALCVAAGGAATLLGRMRLAEPDALADRRTSAEREELRRKLESRTIIASVAFLVILGMSFLVGALRK